MILKWEVFQDMQFILLKKAISQEILNLLSDYFNMQRINLKYFLESDEIPRAKERYGDLMGESLLKNLKPLFEEVTGLQLLPTYSFFRMYEQDASLFKHVDRPACEISGTLVIDYKADELWPIYVQGPENPIAVGMDRGDLLIYKGCELEHWRETFQGHYWMQLFLHYVDSNGPNVEHKYDGRIQIGLPHGARSKKKE